MIMMGLKFMNDVPFHDVYIHALVRDERGQKIETRELVLAKRGALSTQEYDRTVSDLVNYLVYMGEPAKSTRIQTGVLVLFFLALLFILAYALKKDYWKDIH